MRMQQPNACLHKNNYLSYWIWIKPSFMLLTIFAWKNLLPKNRKRIPQGNQNLRTILCMDCIVFNSTGHRNQTTSSLWKKGTTLLYFTTSLTNNKGRTSASSSKKLRRCLSCISTRWEHESMPKRSLALSTPITFSFVKTSSPAMIPPVCLTHNTHNTL